MAKLQEAAPPKFRKKMVARQTLFDQRRLCVVQENEVFLFEGDDLPAEEVAVLVEDDAKLGPMPTQDEPRMAPSYTTEGFVREQHARRGARELLDGDELLG